MANGREQVDVVIVGAGPTGATAAIMLGRKGISCLVLERWTDVFPLPRAVHFDDEVFRILAGLRLSDELRKISRPAPGMRLIDRHHNVLVEFGRDQTRQFHGFPQANMFDQPALERLLRDTIESSCPTVEMHSGVEVTGITELTGSDGPVEVHFTETESGRQRRVFAEYVLGCDGANSFTRDAIGSALDDFGFSQEWLVVDARIATEINAYDGVEQVCDPDATATFMPVLAGHYRWEFRLGPTDRQDDFDDARVSALIAPWLGDLRLEDVTLIRQACYTFRGAIAATWSQGRVILLGDAAHQTPPFIGQGMCAGIRDAENVAWKLALVLQGRAHPRLLSTYEPERREHVRQVIRLAVAVGKTMAGGSQRTVRLRHAAMRLGGAIPRMQERAVSTFWPPHPNSTIVHRRQRTDPAGHFYPRDNEVGSGPRRSIDDIIDGRFAVFHRAQHTVDAFEPSLIDWFDDADIPLIDLDHQSGPCTALHRFLDTHRCNAILTRPDRIVMASADRPDLRSWQRLLIAAGIEPHRTTIQ